MGRRGGHSRDTGSLRVLYREHARTAFLALVSLALAALAVGVAALAATY